MLSSASELSHRGLYTYAQLLMRFATHLKRLQKNLPKYYCRPI